MGSSERVVVGRYQSTTYRVTLFDVPGRGGHLSVTWDQLSLADCVIVMYDLSVGENSTLQYLQFFKVLGVKAEIIVVGENFLLCFLFRFSITFEIYYTVNV